MLNENWIMQLHFWRRWKGKGCIWVGNSFCIVSQWKEFPDLRVTLVLFLLRVLLLTYIYIYIHVYIYKYTDMLFIEFFIQQSSLVHNDTVYWQWYSGASPGLDTNISTTFSTQRSKLSVTRLFLQLTTMFSTQHLNQTNNQVFKPQQSFWPLVNNRYFNGLWYLNHSCKQCEGRKNIFGTTQTNERLTM